MQIVLKGCRDNADSRHDFPPSSNIDSTQTDMRLFKFLLQVSVAMGCAARERNLVFASTLASFFTRAYDQLRIAAISDSSINLCGSHCGLSTG